MSSALPILLFAITFALTAIIANKAITQDTAIATTKGLERALVAAAQFIDDANSSTRRRCRELEKEVLRLKASTAAAKSRYHVLTGRQIEQVGAQRARFDAEVAGMRAALVAAERESMECRREVAAEVRRVEIEYRKEVARLRRELSLVESTSKVILGEVKRERDQARERVKWLEARVHNTNVAKAKVVEEAKAVRAQLDDLWRKRRLLLDNAEVEAVVEERVQGQVLGLMANCRMVEDRMKAAERTVASLKRRMVDMKVEADSRLVREVESIKEQMMRAFEDKTKALEGDMQY